MSITLTATYREVLAPETVSLIDTLVDDNYDLGCMLEFIDEHNEHTFQDSYELYVELSENHGYEAVDAWINLADCPEDLGHFEAAYIGESSSPEEMAEEYFTECCPELDRLDYRIVIDFEETAGYLLNNDVDRVGDFYFRSTY